MYNYLIANGIKKHRHRETTLNLINGITTNAVTFVEKKTRKPEKEELVISAVT